MTLKIDDMLDSKIFSTAALAGVTMQDAPIPAAWVLSGNPHARSGAAAHSIDGWASSVVWECTAGSFRWQFGWEETVVILEGSVKVIAETGEVKLLSQGDVAYFAAGTSAEWQIDSYVRKIAFARAHVPSYVRTPITKLRNLRAGVEGLARSFTQARAGLKLAAAVGVGGSLALMSMVFDM